MRVYSWKDANVTHIAKHSVERSEAEYIVDHARPPFPDHVGDGKWRVWGKTRVGRWLEVVYVYPDDADVEPDSLSVSGLMEFSDGRAQVVYVIHARNLTAAEKRQARKRG